MYRYSHWLQARSLQLQQRHYQSWDTESWPCKICLSPQSFNLVPATHSVVLDVNTPHSHMTRLLTVHRLQDTAVTQGIPDACPIAGLLYTS